MTTDDNTSLLIFMFIYLHFPLKLSESEIDPKWIVSSFVVRAESRQWSRVQNINHGSHNKKSCGFISGGIFFFPNKKLTYYKKAVYIKNLNLKHEKNANRTLHFRFWHFKIGLNQICNNLQLLKMKSFSLLSPEIIISGMNADTL